MVAVFYCYRCIIEIDEEKKHLKICSFSHHYEMTHMSSLSK